MGAVEHIQLIEGSFDDIWWQFANAPLIVAVVQGMCQLVAKRRDHSQASFVRILSLTWIPCKREFEYFRYWQLSGLTVRGMGFQIDKSLFKIGILEDLA
jgi:hypothetical protein